MMKVNLINFYLLTLCGCGVFERGTESQAEARTRKNVDTNQVESVSRVIYFVMT
jgi:hypothetical protein